MKLLETHVKHHRPQNNLAVALVEQIKGTMSIPVNYQKVRIKQMLRDAREYNGWNLNKRLPLPGDIGTLIDSLHAPGLPDHYVVEKTESNGTTIWLSEFLEEELETIT